MVDNIKEIASRMNRSEFLNWYSSEHNRCPKELEINGLCVTDDDCDRYQKCSDCIKEAIKDIKFKDELENETFEAECIESGYNEKNGQLTKDKKYLVKQSRYTNFYELENDLGNIETYRKERFRKIEKPIIKVGAKEFYKNGDVTYPISEEAYKKAMEGDKVENKMKTADEIWGKGKKVECIDNEGYEGYLMKEKEVKKFTFKEVIANINKNEKYTDGTTIISTNDSKITIEGSKISFTYSETYREFTKVEEPKTVSTVEAFKALEEGNICFNKQCQHNKNNGCNIQSVTENCGCDAKLNEPINYEEEYNKLKKDNDELKETNEGLGNFIKAITRERNELKEKYTNMEKSLRHNELQSKYERIEILNKENNDLKEKEIKLIEEKIAIIKTLASLI